MQTKFQNFFLNFINEKRSDLLILGIKLQKLPYLKSFMINMLFVLKLFVKNERLAFYSYEVHFHLAERKVKIIRSI